MPDRVISERFEFGAIHLTLFGLCFLDTNNIEAIFFYPINKAFGDCRADAVQIIGNKLHVGRFCYFKKSKGGRTYGDFDCWKSAIFTEEIAKAVVGYMRNPAASSCGDVNLMKALHVHNTYNDEWIHLDEIPFKSSFTTRNGQQFIKGHQLRKNFECFDLQTKHKYFIHPLMEVKIIEEVENLVNV